MPSPSPIGGTSPQPAQSVRSKAPARALAEETPDAASGGFAALLGRLGEAAPLQEQASGPLPAAVDTAGGAPESAWSGSPALDQGLAALSGQPFGVPAFGGQALPSSGLLPAGRRAGTLVAETARMDSALEVAETAPGTGSPVAARPGMAGPAPAVAAALAAAAQAQAKNARSMSAASPAQSGTAAAHGAALAPSALVALADSNAVPVHLEGGAGLAAALRSALDAQASPASADALAVLAPAWAQTGADSTAGKRLPGQGAGAAAGGDLSSPAAQAESAPAVPGSDTGAPLPDSTNTPDAVTEQMAYWAADQVQNAALTLTHDGMPVQVHVSLDGQHAHVAFRSDQSDTRALLDANTGQLRDLLGQEGLVLSGVSVGSDGAQSGAPPRHPQGRGAVRQATVVAAGDPAAAGERPAQPGVLSRRRVDLFV